ncbi:PAS domain S-box protein [Scytonema sp. UIC 10036]|nr:PAS domain S-box protein [Scytonema sp. UIC 10036]
MLVVDVISQMSQAQTSYVLVFHEQELVGILTETDVVRAIGNRTLFENITVAEAMTQPVITISKADAEQISIVMQKFHQHDLCHLPVMDNNELIGVITRSNVLRVLYSMGVHSEIENLSLVDINARNHAKHMLELQAVITRNMAEGICLVRATDGIIVYANPKFETMFGYDIGELTDRHVSIVNYEDEHTTAEDVNQAIRAAVLRHGEATYEVHNVKKDGTPFWCRATTSVFEHPEYGKVLVAVQQDITEHKQAEDKLQKSLKEKEVLLKEIHHRVKNNLGIVSSLLQMQCRRTQEPQVTSILLDSQNRIASIALIHEKLYRSEDLANINFAQYIPDLVTHLFDSYNTSSSLVKLYLQIEDVGLDIESAIPCGLIVNELVSNALKYAFTNNQAGEILVKLYEHEHQLTLIVQDNGVGLPLDFESKRRKTLGINLIEGLVKQLRGSIEINSQQGTQFKINLKKG